MALTAEQRARKAQLEREIAEIMDPENKAAKERRRQERAASIKRVGKRAPGQRQPREHDAGYLAFLRRLPCIAGVMGRDDCAGATQAAHLRFSDAARGRVNPGMQSRPSDRFATPICEHHHLRDQHARQEQAFWNSLGVDPGDLSAALYAAYLAGEDGLTVLRRFTPSPSKETA